MDFKHIGDLKVIKPEKLREAWRTERRRAKMVKIGAAAVLASAVLIGSMGMTVLAVSGTHDPIETHAETKTAPRGPGEVLETEAMIEVTAAETEAEAESPAETSIEESVEEASEAETTAPEMTYAGEFKLTAYCSCPICCGKWAYKRQNGIVYTKSGAVAEAGVTIAVDPKVIPLGTHVYIDGMGEYIAQDTGSAIKGNRIDVYMDSHDAACHFADGAGSCKLDVWIIETE